MKKKFCPKCGKETNLLVEGLCKDCFEEKSELIEVPDKIYLTTCRECGKINGKRKNNFSMKKFVKRNIKEIGKLKELEIKEEKVGNKIFIEINASGKVKGILKEENKKTVVIIRKRLCESCGKIKGGYYEAVLQIRSSDERKIMDTFKKIEKIIKNSGSITKVEKRRNGIDIFFTPKGLGDKIIKNIEHEEAKKSYTLATRKDGKDLYRTTILLRL